MTERGKNRGKNLISLDVVRGTTKDPCLLILRGLFSRLCWQNYQDLQSFYFHLLVLIGPARFNKSFFAASPFLSDPSKCLSFSNRGVGVTSTGLLTGLSRKMSVKPRLWAELSTGLCALSLSLSTDCLYGVGRGINNFWLHLWIICKFPGPPRISYNL